MCPIPSFLPEGEYWTCECGNEWFKTDGMWRQFRIVARPPTAAPTKDELCPGSGIPGGVFDHEGMHGITCQVCARDFGVGDDLETTPVHRATKDELGRE
jgi:hypothetical protein